jgi:cytochrome P450
MSQVIKAGEGIVGAVQAGNRDPDVFTNPHDFDIRRHIDPDLNLAFGHGPHRCQAQWLSRVELEIAFGEPYSPSSLPMIYHADCEQPPSSRNCRS